jgi:hypothetical protein
MKRLLVTVILSVALLPYANAQHPTNVKVKHAQVRFPPPVFEFDPCPVSIDSLSKHIFEAVIVSGKVYGFKITKQQTLLYLGAAYPTHLLMVVLKEAESKRLARSLKGKVIAVTGKLFTDNDRDDGRPVMYINFPYSLNVVVR